MSEAPNSGVLPNIDHAVIPPAKLRDYLLSPAHPDGRSKAQFFRSLGFLQEDWVALGRALEDQHLVLPAQEIERNPFGRKFAIVGPLIGPNGNIAGVKSVWIIRNGEDFPRLLTAYPET
ncbi:MAG: DUF6883 domain-containing protein [Dehalococcoidia bacterium]